MADEVVIRCHCGQLAETVQLREALPAKGFMCHCNICRHVSGTLTFTGIYMSNPPVETFKQKLVKYATSEKLWRYFCATCGSQVVYYVVKEDRWMFCPGAIDAVKRGEHGKVDRITAHEYVGDTLDGGLSLCIPDVPYYLEDDGQESVKDLQSELKRLQAEATTELDSEDKLRAECHCGQVSLLIGRPDHGRKWRGGICVCRSCRLSFSQTLVAWLLNVKDDKIFSADGKPYDDSTVGEGMRRFQSSDLAHRDFCTKCGASIFYSAKDEPGQVDIGVGLLRAKEGALARSWVRWDSKLHHIDDAIDVALVEIVKANLAALNDE